MISTWYVYTLWVSGKFWNRTIYVWALIQVFLWNIHDKIVLSFWRRWCKRWHQRSIKHFDGVVQDRCSSIPIALKILKSRSKPAILSVGPSTVGTPQKYLPDVALTHWGQVTHICVRKLNAIGSDNGLSPGRGLNVLTVFPSVPCYYINYIYESLAGSRRSLNRRSKGIRSRVRELRYQSTATALPLFLVAFNWD